MNSKGRKKVFIIRKLPMEAINLLKLHLDVRVNEEYRTINIEEHIDNIKTNVTADMA